MEVRVHGKNVQISDDLRVLVEEKVGHAGRIFDNGGVADVEFTAHQNPRVGDDRVRVEITTGQSGHVVRVEARAHDERSALDGAIDKFERQLRRLKERLIQRSRKASNKHLNTEVPRDEEVDGDGLEIVRTKRFVLKPMTPEEAALQMEMLGHSFYFFLSSETDEFSVLYHRKDGTLGLIEAE